MGLGVSSSQIGDECFQFPGVSLPRIIHIGFSVPTVFLGSQRSVFQPNDWCFQFLQYFWLLLIVMVGWWCGGVVMLMPVVVMVGMIEVMCKG